MKKRFEHGVNKYDPKYQIHLLTNYKRINSSVNPTNRYSLYKVPLLILITGQFPEQVQLCMRACLMTPLYLLTLWCYTNAVIIIIIFLGPTSTKQQAEILKLNNINGCNDISFGDHSILEGDRIPPLKCHGQALEEELCFPGVLSDNRDAPANLLRHFYGCLMPCTYCLDYYYYYMPLSVFLKLILIRMIICYCTGNHCSVAHSTYVYD